MSLKLNQLNNFSRRPGPVVLMIMDGVGLGKKDDSDGVFLADTPCLDQLMQSSFYTQLKAHGTAVGMPSDDDMGNSEVGHNALGAGRIFAQGAKLCQQSIDSGDIFKTATWTELSKRVKDNASTYHLIGLLSDGNVHAHIRQWFALLNQLAKEGVQRVRLHTLLDGRDVPETSGLGFLQKTEELLAQLNTTFGVDYAIASGGGRMITTMDRYNADWSIVERGWNAHVLGEARGFKSAKEAVETYYKEDPKITDQYLESFVVVDENGQAIGTINDGDSVVLMNFRGDRAIELSMAFDQDVFDKFDRKRRPDVLFAGMVQYDGDLKIPNHYLVNPPKIDQPVSEYMCANGIKSFAISETQKYGHVTYFWNGNNSGYIDEALETYIEIPSDKIRFEQKPAMKAYEITDKVIKLIRSGEYQFGRLNFPNGDMVGHTGIKEAIIKSVEVTDECVAKILAVLKEVGGVGVILADHGNADEMYKITKGKKEVSTAHSLNPVPCAIVDYSFNGEYHLRNLEARGLTNIAATLLNLLGLEAPADYDPSLIEMNA